MLIVFETSKASTTKRGFSAEVTIEVDGAVLQSTPTTFKQSSAFSETGLTTDSTVHLEQVTTKLTTESTVHLEQLSTKYG